MKPRPLILRIAAFLLILVFSQKAGAGLFIHEIFHTEKTNSEFPTSPNEKNNASYACSCVDDFLMPFVDADQPVYTQPAILLAPSFASFCDDIPFLATIFSSLRAPPASIA